ncbi:MAG: class II glutamine amidotransferase, partial [Verrucomicrobia bacterium]|nr:class II glutamine amidotransferase [Verrucomicrobiota bacterium]
MCGIVGYLGNRVAKDALIDGLRRLEYRGYDSAGAAFHDGNAFSLVRETGRVENLAAILRESNPTSTLGIAHTRWATHGAVTISNTHPHLSNDGKIALVHNGVIENYGTLKRILEGKGIEFASETDSEVLSNLIAYHYARLEGEEDRFTQALREALSQCRGAYGIAVLCVDEPGFLLGARRGSPLVVGLGDGETFLVSDASAFVGRVRDAVYLKDGEIALLREDDFRIITMQGEDTQVVSQLIDQTVEDVEMGDFDSFMEKEIFEQPVALENTL